MHWLAPKGPRIYGAAPIAFGLKAFFSHRSVLAGTNVLCIIARDALLKGPLGMTASSPPLGTRSAPCVTLLGTISSVQQPHLGHRQGSKPSCGYMRYFMKTDDPGDKLETMSFPPVFTTWGSAVLATLADLNSNRPNKKKKFPNSSNT